jgi:enoyl-CoA hydratase/carnithine racemase
MYIQTPPESVGREVRLEVVDQVAKVILDRPESRNAINGSVVRALSWIVDEVEINPSIAVAVLCSAELGMFCAGADLAEIARGGGADLVDSEKGFGGFVKAVRTKPWIAAVDGAAMGGGFELALACDMIVVSDRAVLGLPEVKRGLMAMAGGAIRLPRRLPRALAIEALMTGEPINADLAMTHGLVNRVTTPDALEATALELARQIARNAPIALRESLELARAADGIDESALWSANDKATLRVVTSNDAREGPRAFIEKRQPKWSGS